MSAAALLLIVVVGGPSAQPAAAQADHGAGRLVVFLAENRPIFVRLRVTSQGRPFENSWIDSIRVLHASLDRNGDGTVTTKEADPKVVAALVRLARGPAEAAVPLDLDVHPKDGKLSIEELADGLLPILGPFRLEVARQAVGRTDALFEQLDRDKDEQLTRPELGAIAGSLRPLDLDDDEMTSADELEPLASPAFTAMMEQSSERQARFTALPPVVEIVVGESSLRPARLLLKKYDKGKGDRDPAGRRDGKLSPDEFAIDPDAFARADLNSDELLDTDELRKLLTQPPVDLSLDVTLSPAEAGRPTARVEPGGSLPKGAQVRRLADGDVEFAIGKIRLDVHVGDDDWTAQAAKRSLEQQFKAADTNKDGYLEGKEQAAINLPQSPIAGLSNTIDRDGDGKIYLKELLAFVDRQQEAARGRLVVTTADQGRAIFGIVDLDRDRRLGARELMRAVERVMTWDADGDGRVSPDEIPYHFQVTIARSWLAGLSGDSSVAARQMRAMAASQAAQAPAGAGPEWFQKMDRNSDGDISRREFLGPRDQFDRLDRDSDGLINADEARAAEAPAEKPAR